ncbi:MAG: hypothetical protein JOZ57_08030, partial [Abitibacteriaceae bacterium]|nr:hypothetical protein [Abditibacteriaceae bacterium]
MQLFSSLLVVLLFCFWVAPSGQAAPTPSATWHITPVSSLHKLTARTVGVLEPFTAEPVQLHAARGEWECFQIVITAGNQPLSDVSVTSTGLATHLGEYLPVHNVQLFWENYVLVSHPSGNRRLEQLWWPDALIPTALHPRQTVAPGQSIVAWGAVQVPLDARSGEYYGAVDIVANGEAKQLAIALTVEPITLPKASMRGNVAIYYDVLRDWYQKNLKPLDDAQFARMKRQYYEFVLDYHINAYDLPVPWN